MWNILRTVGSAVLQPVSQAVNSRYNMVASSLFHTLCRTQTPSSFLIPKPVIITPVAGIKVKGILKLRCSGCRKYVRDQRSYIYCMNFPKHNQKSMVKKHYNRWHLTHATQSKIKPY